VSSAFWIMGVEVRTRALESERWFIKEPFEAHEKVVLEGSEVHLKG
jgi:hypothetical protein